MPSGSTCCVLASPELQWHFPEGWRADTSFAWASLAMPGSHGMICSAVGAPDNAAVGRLTWQELQC